MTAARRSIIALSAFAIAVVIGGHYLVQVLNRPIVGSVTEYSAIFADTSGLYAGDDVRVAGVAVGKVESIELAGTHARVHFSVESSRDLYTNTIVAVRFQNLTGQRFMSLDSVAPHAAKIAPGKDIPLDQTRPPIDITAVFNGLKPVFDTLSPEQVNKLTSNMLTFLQGDGAGLAPLLTDIDNISTAVADRDQVIASLLDNLGAVATSLTGRSHDFTTLLTQVKLLVDTMHSKADNLTRFLDVGARGMFPLGVLVAHIDDVFDANSVTISTALTRMLGDGEIEQVRTILASLPLGLDSATNALSRIQSGVAVSCDNPDTAVQIPATITIGDRAVRPCN